MINNTGLTHLSSNASNYAFFQIRKDFSYSNLQKTLNNSEKISETNNSIQKML